MLAPVDHGPADLARVPPHGHRTSALAVHEVVHLWSLVYRELPTTMCRNGIADSIHTSVVLEYNCSLKEFMNYRKEFINYIHVYITSEINVMTL